MNAEIIAVGTEILLGDINNSHAQFLSKQLALLGVNVHYQTAVGDNVARLKKVLDLALTRSDIIITTGGLGPTADDLTKETVCEALGVECELRQDILDGIKAYFAKSGREMPENNKKQAMLPKNCVVFQNENGTAPGMALESEKQIVIMLPGPPRELIPMFQNEVMPYLAQFSEGSIVSKMIQVMGVGESKVEEMLGDILDGSNPTVALYAKTGQVQIRVTALAPSEEEANEMMRPVIVQIRSILGDAVYGVDEGGLEQVVVEKLKAAGMMIATAESCTGGLLSQKITSVSGSSQVFEFGISSYANRVKEQMLKIPRKVIDQKGAVSQSVAVLMANGAQVQGNADIGVGITGIAGPGGGTEEDPVGTVYIAVTKDGDVWVKRYQFGHGSEDERDYIRELAALNALNMVRLILDESEDALNEMIPIDQALEEDNLDGNVLKKPWYKRFFLALIPWKGDSVNEIVRKCVFLVALIVFLVCAGVIIDYFRQNVVSDQVVQQTQALYTEEPTPEALAELPDGVLEKFANLYAANDDIKGWITIPNSKVDYPVVQADDNDYYLRRDFYQNYNNNGVPFIDYRCTFTKDAQSTNTIIYAHNIRGGRFFQQITNYKDLSFYKQSPVITFDSIYEEAQYKVISAFIVNVNGAQDEGNVFDYHNFINAQSEEHFNWFIEEITRRSIIDTPVDVQPTDKLLTLSTCTYEFDDARFVVVARKVRPGESATVDVSQAIYNPKTLYPQAYYDKYGGTKPDYPDNPKPNLIDDGTEQIAPPDSPNYTGPGTSSGGSSTQNTTSTSAQPSSNTPGTSSVPPASSSSAGGGNEDDDGGDNYFDGSLVVSRPNHVNGDSSIYYPPSESGGDPFASSEGETSSEQPEDSSTPAEDSSVPDESSEPAEPSAPAEDSSTPAEPSQPEPPAESTQTQVEEPQQ